MSVDSGLQRKVFMAWRTFWSAVVAWAVVNSLGAERASAQCRYEVSAVIEGPEICGVFGRASVFPTAINDHGVVTGTYNCPGGFGQPFMWSEEMGFVAIPLPPGIPDASPQHINNDNVVVGWLNTFGSGGTRAFIYHDGELTILPPGVGGLHSGATASNDNGVVVGFRDIKDVRHAFRFENGKFQDIQSPIGSQAIAEDVNANANAVGTFGALDSHAFRWIDRNVDDLGTVLGGPSATGRGVDESGTIVGGARVVPDRGGSPATHAYVLADKVAIDLGVPEPFDHSAARDVNEAGQVLVLATEVFNTYGNFIWQNGDLTELPLLFEQPDPNIVLGHMASLNNRGQITGWANQQVIGGFSVGVVLSPVESPLGDVNLDCSVDELDLMTVLGDWGFCQEGLPCLCDIVTSATFQPPGDGVVDGADLAVVLGNWSNLAPSTSARRGG